MGEWRGVPTWCWELWVWGPWAGDQVGGQTEDGLEGTQQGWDVGGDSNVTLGPSFVRGQL